MGFAPQRTVAFGYSITQGPFTHTRPRPYACYSLVNCAQRYSGGADGDPGAGTKDYPRVMALARALARHVEAPDPGDSADEVRATASGSHPWFECLVTEVNGGIVRLVSFWTSSPQRVPLPQIREPPG